MPDAPSTDTNPIGSGQDSGNPPDEAARRRQVIHIVVLDVLVLAELAIAVYGANALRDRWDFTLVFCAIFFGLVIPTILISRAVMRRVSRDRPT